jgi:NADPH:quinone reductase-like Zn-dependent oxidoreductase/acyl carrier protein
MDLTTLLRAIEGDAPAPDVVLARVMPKAQDGDLAERTRELVRSTLTLLQGWLSHEPLRSAQLVLVTHRALAVGTEEAPDLASAAAAGLMRSAQSEHPGRFVHVDLDPDEDGATVDWAALLTAGEPQIAVRKGSIYVPRLARIGRDRSLVAPADGRGWRLLAERKGTLEGLAIVPGAQDEPLGSGQVRIEVRAAGLNFRDVLIALHAYPGDAEIGSEGAGIVVEVDQHASGLNVGDRVMGLFDGAFGPLAVADHRALVRIPEGWSFSEAAAVPIAFLTAYYALVELAELKHGESLLVHAGAGGVGSAAVQIARHLGAEVYATASPAKWEALKGLVLDERHLASSRALDFREQFLTTTGERGVDAVLNALSGEFVDASLELLPRGGRFIEMGKTDIRDPDRVAAEHPGVRYRAFDLLEAGPERIQRMLAEVVALFERGALRQLPIACWDMRRAVEAFRHLREGHNVGKVVLTVPPRPDPDGTVLITGGTGAIGALVARHLAGAHGARHLLLASRSGPAAQGAARLQADLAQLGCTAEIVACDVADRQQLRQLLSRVSREHPLTAVIHAAGVLDDGTIETLDTERIDTVLRPKLDAALHLHELTQKLELAQFVLFSSGSATTGTPGQGNYAAANASLDALARLRRAQGLQGQALAWGLWLQEPGAGMGGLKEADRARLGRLGVVALPPEDGLELFDAARAFDEPFLVPAHLDFGVLRAHARAGLLPPLLQGLVRATVRRKPVSRGSLASRLASTPEGEREGVVLEAVCAVAASVLGYDSAEAIDPQATFRDLGVDSLAAVEMYNYFCEATALPLPTTLGFDHPTPVGVAQFLREQMEGERPSSDPAGASSGSRFAETLA